MAVAKTPTNIYDVILEFQADPPSLVKDTDGRVGPRKYMYVDLNQVVERVVHERLNKMGCIVTQPMDGDRLGTIIRHVASGTEIQSVSDLPDAKTPQDMGKAITYLRRYSLVSLLCLVGEDDNDGSGFATVPVAATAAVGEDAGSLGDVPWDVPSL